jgi:phage baseplate assembly protein W
MTTFIGFNTQGQNKSFTLVDYELVRRDLINALNIKQGQVPGIPDYGTTLWSYLFENQTLDTERAITAELQRVCAQDPRLYVNSLQLFPQENGMLIQMQVLVVPSTVPQLLTVFFDQISRRATYV